MRFAFLLILLAARTVAAELTLAIEPRWQGERMAVPSGEFVQAPHQAIRITRLSALISGVALARADGGIVRLDGQYGFIDAESGRLSVAFSGVPEGDYAGIEFQLGVAPAINHATPDKWPAGHPLNPLVNGLYWGWQGGYVFFALEGRWRDVGTVDKGAAPAQAERGFSYHLATDARIMTVRFAANYRVQDASTLTLALDLARILGGHKLAADDGSETTHSGKNDELAPKLAGAVEHAFFFLGVETTVPTPPMEASNRALRGAAMAEASQSTRPSRTVAGTTPHPFTVPAGWPQPELPADNPLTDEGVALGEKLFSDPRLSGNGTQSCASCHAASRAFSDRVALSVGADGKRGLRNAMPLANLAWSTSFAWDGSKPRIRDQALAAMTNPIEMHGVPEKVVATLATDEAMRDAFNAAFGASEITAEKLSLALEQYLLTQVSANSKFDRALRGTAELSEEEKEGFALFLTEYDPARGRQGADCFHCHGGPLFSDFAFKNNGLDLKSADHGRALVTDRATDEGKFKTPSLRNVALTGPYMHDGRFKTLEEVVAHYDHGVQRNAALDPNLAKHPEEGMKLSAADQRALVAFLRTLTDERWPQRPSS